ncbi:hypothetical protein C8J56DRAFT_1054095 [Mycena floridula]|nr:hypothetical protein C8J56DRAFT_1054095 [Mycena floridula]
MSHFNSVYQWLDRHNLTIFDLLVSTLQGTTGLGTAAQSHRAALHQRAVNILDLFLEQKPTDTESWATTLAVEIYRREIVIMTQLQSVFHFTSSRATLERLESFSVGDLAKKMRETCPHVWKLTGVLLDANAEHRAVTPNT